ncbi:MAG: hypothetical protein K2X93_17835 [Candidatus Obscuribacterales bacterium]|nr:hypothetical protein [Candidatus Obscuribacterales bacterium]
MTYQEDYPPFAGDQTGQLLAEPDVVALSPITSARVVETQSGYLVVIKRAEDRLSLSVKRRIGTPPSSQVLLTPDESVQLSRVLTDSAEALVGKGDFLIREIQQRTAQVEENDSTDAALGDIYTETEGSDPKFDWDEIKQPWRKRRAMQSLQQIEIAATEATKPPIDKKNLKKSALVIAGGITAIAAIIGIVIAASMVIASNSTNSSQAQIAHKAAANPMHPDRVDKFVRNFVSNMLDFNPKTYRASQIHAMAVMNSDMLEKYWQETAFPLSKAKLRALHKDQTLMINKIVQQPSSAVTTEVEMSADLVIPGEDNTTPLRLQIDLGLNDEGRLTVTEMKDASSKTD